MVIDPSKCEFMSFGKTSEMRYLPIMKSDLKKCYQETAWYYNRPASQFQQTYNKCKSASRKLNALSRVSSLLSYQ